MRRAKSFEATYPTKVARAKADEAFDRLDISRTTLAEAIRVWEWHYLDAGGIVKG